MNKTINTLRMNNFLYIKQQRTHKQQWHEWMNANMNEIGNKDNMMKNAFEIKKEVWKKELYLKNVEWIQKKMNTVTQKIVFLSIEIW